MITCQVGKKKIDTFSYEPKQLREWSDKRLLKCPICGTRMIYNHGEFKIPHFKHEKNSDCPDIYSEGVTEEHIKGIEILYNWLEKQDGVSNIELEKWIPETKQRPDIYFEYKNKSYVIEFQCSPISTKFLERRELYRLNEINDIWILGCNKYSISELKTVHTINMKDISFKLIKHKTIETELAEMDNNVFYLSKDRLIKTNENSKCDGYKTIFNKRVNSKLLEEIDIDNIILNKSFYKDDELSELSKQISKTNELIDYIYMKYNDLINVLRFDINLIYKNNDINIDVFGDMGRNIFDVTNTGLEQMKNYIENNNVKYREIVNQYITLEMFCEKMRERYQRVDGFTDFDIEYRTNLEYPITIKFYNNYHLLHFHISLEKFKAVCEICETYYRGNIEIENVINIDTKQIIKKITNHCSSFLREMKYGGKRYEKAKTI